MLVPEERRSDAVAALDDRDFEYAVTPELDRDEVIVEVPVSDEAVGPVVDSLTDAGVDVDRYAVVEELGLAATPTAGEIRERYADRYDRPSHRELGSLADELNWDVRSFAAMLGMSAIVAAVGILIDSPVIVVGSGVIAPLVNPMLVAGIGTVLGERWMIGDSLRLQGLGLVIVATVAFATGAAAEALSIAPSTLTCRLWTWWRPGSRRVRWPW